MRAATPRAIASLSVRLFASSRRTDWTKKYPVARRTMTVRPARMTAVAHRALRPARGERSDLLATAWTLWRHDDAQCPDHRFISVSKKGNRGAQSESAGHSGAGD